MIGELPKKFNRRLCSILFLSGHVQVINEDDESLAVRWTIDSHSALFTLIIDEVLSLIRRSLSGECHLEGLVLLTHLECGQLRDVDTLTSSSRSWSQHVLHVRDESLQEVLHSDRVLGGHNNLIVWLFDIDCVGFHCVEP